MANTKIGLRTIFEEALQIGTSQEVSKYLDEVCNGDGSLRGEVEALLASHREAGSFLGGPAPEVSPTADIAAEQLGKQIGPYKLLQKLGEGGFGVVYMAEQKHPVDRRVALKIIKPGMDTGQVIARFEAERQVLAMMDHPGIAKIFDAGATDSGHPFFVMELVKGIPITQYCDEQHLTPEQRLELFAQVCQAVQHAHQKGIIHRDLKPQNVLVAEFDKKPVPKVIDFGIAKATNQRLTEKTIFTQLGQFLGTPEYMSPEQAEVNQLDVDTRSDIYSLGVILYELLTGVTPLERERLRAAGYDEILRMIREEDPPKPSTRVSTLGASAGTMTKARRITIDRLRKLIRGDLDWIVMKALEKDRARRYETADALAVDIQRYLSEETVLARPPSSLDRFQKFARRNKRGLLIAAGLAICVLLFGGSAWAIRHNADARNEFAAAFASFMATKPDSLLEQVESLRASPAAGAFLAAVLEQAPPDASLLHARLVLLGTDDRHAEMLVDSLLDEDHDPAYLTVIRDALIPFSDLFSERLWSVFEDEDEIQRRRFRAGVTLALLAPESSRWQGSSSEIQLLADVLVEKRADYQAEWRTFARPIASEGSLTRSDFLDGLGKRFHSGDSEVRLNSVRALVDFASRDHTRMAELLSSARPEQFRILFSAVEEKSDSRLISALERIVKESPVPDLTLEGRVSLGSRRAGAAIALLRFSEYRSVLPVFEHSDDPEAMTQFIHRCRERGVKSSDLLACLKFSEDESLCSDQLRYALTLALGEFASRDELAAEGSFIRGLENSYQTNPNSGVHSATGWLLRKLNRDAAVNRVDKSEFAYSPDRGWFTHRVPTPDGDFHLTFAVIPAGEYEIGSPEDEPKRETEKERRHKVTFSRPFAVLDREVTFAELKAFKPALVDRMKLYQGERDGQAAPGPNWEEAVDFCRWLSECAGIAEEAQAYSQERSLRLDQPGSYRLPTEAEWEVACRVGMKTRHFHGNDDNLLTHYGWFGMNSNKELNAPRLKMPNPYGLFDTHGNLFEWCHDWMQPYPEELSPTDYAGPQVGMKRVLRGGCWGVSPDLCRSANRMAHTPDVDFIFMGIRLAMTLPESTGVVAE